MLLLFSCERCETTLYFYIFVDLSLFEISSKANWFLLRNHLASRSRCCVSENHACPREVRSEHKTSSVVVNGLPGAPLRVLYDKSHELRHRNFVRVHNAYKYDSQFNEMRNRDVN